MKRVVVVGGGPAGAFAAEKLASSGLETIVLDEKLAWEKPCGGGLTYKAWSRYPFLVDNETPKRLVTETRMAASGVGSVKLALEQPLVIYSRLDLNKMLLKRAEDAGAHIEKTRVLEVAQTGSRWRLKTRNGDIEADFCVVATGARNSLRNVGTEWTRDDTMYALGYYVAANQEHIDIQFLRNLEGYIWVFPRCGHLSVGICGKGEPAPSLRARLERYMEEKGIPFKDAMFYGHLIPSLATRAWKRNRVAGEGWFGVGDAAGLVDPVTGEGLYYALRSADLATQVLLADAHPPLANSEAYRSLLAKDFAADLEYGSSLAKRLFLGQFLFSDMPTRMVQFMQYSQRFCDVVQDLFEGTQPYLDLKRRLLKNLNGTMLDIVFSFFLRRFVATESSV